jgi:hypothetical protein
MSETPNEERSEEEKYEVDSEWLKQRLESLETGFSKIIEKLDLMPNEKRSDSEEQQEKPQITPSEITVQQETKEIPHPQRKSRLVIRGPKMLRR